MYILAAAKVPIARRGGAQTWRNFWFKLDALL